MKQLANKKVLLGVSGGIAAYKSADLARRLREAGAVVRVVMTSAAKEFITPLTLQAVSGNPVHDDLFDTAAEAAMGHIELARWADVVVVAPATADVIAKLANGQANDLLTTLCLATRAPCVLAPAMNQQMWLAKTTQENCHTLQSRGMHLFGPASGEQACGEVGPGRMLEPLELAEKIAELFTTGSLSDHSILITAGPTQEHLDPVRYLTNHSSGKMGYAMAEAAVEAGAKVTLISGPSNLSVPEHVKHIAVVNAEEMHAAVMSEVKHHTIFIGVAAVADYRFLDVASEKIAKKSDEITLKLIRNPDIIADVAALPHPPFTVGFAAQTENVLAYAREKLRTKHLDLIMANQVNCADRGFDSDNNALTILSMNEEIELPLMSKSQLARELIKIIAERVHAKRTT
jgi:phosphopantothenoylcysteine decarboxylase / phosphopantothenate---cysteine ligase